VNQEPVIIGGAIDLRIVNVVERRRAKGVVLVLLDHVAGLARRRATPIEEMRYAALVVVRVIEGITAVHPRIGAHQNFVDPFAVHIAPDDTG
jgi:hypothetical protein